MLNRLEDIPLSFFPYSTTSSVPIHRNRQEYKNYLLYKEEDVDKDCKSLPYLPISFNQFRFSGIRFQQLGLFDLAQHLEKEQLNDAILTYDRLLRTLSPHHPPSFRANVAQRYALCLHSAQKSKEATQFLLSFLKTENSLAYRLQLIRTGRRIAAGQSRGFLPLPPLNNPLVRSIDLGRSGIAFSAERKRTELSWFWTMSGKVGHFSSFLVFRMRIRVG